MAHLYSGRISEINDAEKNGDDASAIGAKLDQIDSKTCKVRPQISSGTSPFHASINVDHSGYSRTGLIRDKISHPMTSYRCK
tara:strand:- start:621 stop:866 length:246 start_codon:yes stop_codon:yes gene_type:complete